MEARYHEQATGCLAVTQIWLGVDDPRTCAEKKCENKAVMYEHTGKVICEYHMVRACPNDNHLWTAYTMTASNEGKIGEIPKRSLCRSHACLQAGNSTCNSMQYNTCSTCWDKFPAETIWSKEQYAQEMFADNTTPNFTADDKFAHGIAQDTQQPGPRRRWNTSATRGDGWEEANAAATAAAIPKQEEEESMDIEDVSGPVLPEIQPEQAPTPG